MTTINLSVKICIYLINVVNFICSFKMVEFGVDLDINENNEINSEIIVKL